MSTTSFFSTYLSEQKTRFLGDNGKGWTVVMGNEAGDLDSLASSIGFAWLLSHVPSTDTKAISLIRTSREDFVLRTENIHALQLVGIRQDFQELLCPEDLPKPNPCTNFALVDHNSLHPTYSLPGAQVTAIIDHHEDEGKYRDTASPRIIQPVGSCASLVAGVISSYSSLEIPPELATLLLCAIVIDTHGLRKGGKAVDEDYSASTMTNPYSVADHTWIRALSDTLSTKKTAISHLNTRDLLRRDYKEYHFNLSSSICGDNPRSIKAGLATVHLPLSSFFSPLPTAAAVATQEWIKERGLTVLGVLTAFKSKKGKSRRELMWLVDESVCGPRLPQALFDGFEADEVLRGKGASFKRYGFDGQERGDKVGGEEVDGESDEESVGEHLAGPEVSPFGRSLVGRIYRQKNATATRKQVAPILKRMLEG